MPAELSRLKQLTDLIHPINGEDWEQFASLWKPFSAKRKDLITSAGEKERYLYFVLEGVQRIYYFDEQDREATIVFTYPPSFGGIVDSMLLGSPGKYYYEALTGSKFLRAPYEQLQRMMINHPSINEMVNRAVLIAFSGVLERLVELQSFSSAERFRIMLKRSPHILQLVPHKYIANYLGIDPTNFSKLMNTIRI
jgi:CRP-like cAMP-binding protein